MTMNTQLCNRQYVFYGDPFVVSIPSGTNTVKDNSNMGLLEP